MIQGPKRQILTGARVALSLRFLLLLAMLVQARPDSAAVDAFIQTALARRLDTTTTWLALGRWQKTIFGWSGGVDGGYFYLDPEGKKSPRKELVATIRALANDSDLSPFSRDTTAANMHPRVKYRARTRFLRESGMPDSLFAAVDTSRWQRWNNGIRPKRATLVYASSYLGNPASMFGHVLLRFDAGDREGLRDRLNYGITYGAAMPPGDPLYAFKGIFGLYPGFHTILPYYMSLQKYKYLESRDLWEYPLALDSTEVQRLLEIVWEGGAAWNRYYFFTENCATGLARLLDILQPDSGWSKSFPSPSMPPELVRLLRDRKLASPPVLRPSQLSSFLEKRDALDKHELEILEDVVHERRWDSLPTDSQSMAKIMDVAVDYAGWRRREAPKDSGWKTRLDTLLMQRAHLPPSPPETPLRPTSAPAPESAHRPRLLGAWGRWNDRSESEIGMTARLSFHGLEENPTGFQDGSELEAGVLDASVTTSDDPQLHLDRFEFMRIRSLPLWDPWLRSWTWNFRISLRPFEMERTPWFGVDIGKGMAFGNHHARIWAMACGRVGIAPWEEWSAATIGPQAIGGILLSASRASLGLDASWFEGWPTRKHEALGNATARVSVTDALDLDIRGQSNLDGNLRARAGSAWHF